ncbi:MAG: hypothetical protein NT094_04705 [Candidatus Staskawiczbacteria bacterium]|nr:hypothetical protein [Candidatus Staskawiczbacteria bacterium]
MNKKIIYTIVIIILVIIIILVFFIFSNSNKDDYVNLKEVQSPALSLCNRLYNNDEGCPAVSVVPCNYQNATTYRVDYGCTDVPAGYFDSNLNLINDSCWGMPAEGQTKTPQICEDLDEKCQYDNNICK